MTEQQADKVITALLQLIANGHEWQRAADRGYLRTLDALGEARSGLVSALKTALMEQP